MEVIVVNGTIKDAFMGNSLIINLNDIHGYFLHPQLPKSFTGIVKYNDGSRWFKNGLLHREDGPAYDSKEYKAWWINGYRHRSDGPAIINERVRKNSWYLHGICVSFEEVFEQMSDADKEKAIWNLDEWK